MCRLSLGLLALPVTGFASALPGTEAVGWITHNDKTLVLKSAVAVWNEGGKELRIALFPFEVEPHNIETAKQDSGPLRVALGKSSSTPHLWDYAPFAVLRLRFQPRPGVSVRGRVQSYLLEVSFVERKSHTASLNRVLPEEIAAEVLQFDGPLRGGGIVHVAVRGEGRAFNDHLKWDFRLRTEVHQRPSISPSVSR